jgi:RNA polymerase sigma-70 factor (ECF subfamily)
VVKADDSGEFDALYRSLYPLAARTVFLVVLDRPVAQEIVHEAFSRLWQHRDQLDATSDRKSWLMRVAVNLAIDHRRGIIAALRQRAAPAAVPDPSELALARLDIRDMRAALLRLPARDRAVLALRFERELSFPEIGRILGRPEATVKTWLHRALYRLRQDLGPTNYVELVEGNP